jgi:hypothetical protein
MHPLPSCKIGVNTLFVYRKPGPLCGAGIFDFASQTQSWNNGIMDKWEKEFCMLTEKSLCDFRKGEQPGINSSKTAKGERDETKIQPSQRC